MTFSDEKKNKHSWHKLVVRKWLNMKSKPEEFQADEIIQENLLTKTTFDTLARLEPYMSQHTNIQDLRVFVATWNVGGESPHSSLNLDEWVQSSSAPADIYVFGFQEIVPLNAGNILGVEDNGPAAKWLALIRQTLNKNRNQRNSFSSASEDQLYSLDSDFEDSQDHKNFAPFGSVSLEDESALSGRDSPYTVLHSPMPYSSSSNSGEMNCNYNPSEMNHNFNSGQPNYFLAASKQMVGIFLCVWVSNDLRQHVRDIKVSCIGCGLMGYLGNKGSVSMSMLFHETSFCFVCTHLTSGEKEGDEIRRNSDVREIIKKTHFPQIDKIFSKKTPERILEHDRIIWLGDLNYRLALHYADSKELMTKNSWETLLEKDRLQNQKKAGHIFEGWNEGQIYFPPTYKYCRNSEQYAGENLKSKAKRRTPAWCDRILWYGKGLKQTFYVRGESKFSDHRPVYSIFIADVKSRKIF